MLTKEITITISMCGRGGHKRARLQGFAYVSSGFLAGQIVPVDQSFSQAELVLLTAFTLTGCPIAARRCGGICNPWVLTNGAYESSRCILATHFEAQSFLTSRSVHDRIDMDLRVTYKGFLPALIDVAAPFQESITQTSRGVLSGQFEIAFGGEDGARVTANDRSTYALNLGVDVAEAWRNITILCFPSKDNLRQIEQIDLFGSRDEADLDLRQKTHISGIAGGSAAPARENLEMAI